MTQDHYIRHYKLENYASLPQNLLCVIVCVCVDTAESSGQVCDKSHNQLSLERKELTELDGVTVHLALERCNICYQTAQKFVNG